MALQDLTPQLRTRLRRVEKIVSLFVILATLLLLAGFAYYLRETAKRRGWFIPRCHYYTFAMSGEGLNVGDPVMLMGFAVGEITAITAEPPGSWYKVFITFDVRRPYYGYIWSDSKVKIATTGFLGNRRLDVTAGYGGQPTVYETGERITELLVDGKRVPLAAAPKGALIPPEEDAALTERAQKLLAQVEQALPSILSLTNSLAATLGNAAQISSNAVLLTANANGLLTDARPVVTNLAVITAHLREPRGSLGDWLIPTNLNAQLSQTMADADNSLNQLTYQLGLTLMNVANITSNLNTQVQTNDQVLAEISRLVVNTDNLVQGLKKHWLLRGAFPKPKTNAAPAAAKKP